MFAVKTKKKKVKKAVKHPAPEPKLLSPRETAGDDTSAPQGFDGAQSSSAPDVVQSSNKADEHVKDDESPRYEVEDSEEFRNVWGGGE